MTLTPKQEKFCQCIVSGMTGMESYRAAYNTNGKDSTVNQEAVKLLAREDIQERIETLQKPVITAAQTKAISEYERIKALLWERIEVCVANGDDAAIARYTDQINKMNQTYININRNIEDSAGELKELDTSTLLKLVQ